MPTSLNQVAPYRSANNRVNQEAIFMQAPWRAFIEELGGSEEQKSWRK